MTHSNIFFGYIDFFGKLGSLVTSEDETPGTKVTCVSPVDLSGVNAQVSASNMKINLSVIQMLYVIQSF